MARKNSKIIINTILAVIVSISGWMIFEGFWRLLKIDYINPFLLIILGLISTLIVIKVGLNKKIR